MKKQLSDREKVSIPVDGAFLFKVVVGVLFVTSACKVSIPVDGAFLFKAQEGEVFLTNTDRFNPR